MRISITAAVALVLLGVALGYYLGVQQRHVEPDAYGLKSRNFAFSNRYDCEVMAMMDKEPGCEPLTFAQVHAAGFMLVPRETPHDSGRDSND